MTKINLAFSPCPNDTFVFDAIVNQRIDLEGFEFNYSMHDVEALNHQAMKKEIDMVKVSYHAYLYLQRSYIPLDSGGALGMGNGPLLISKKPYKLEDLPGLTVAVPGQYTTAHLLLQLATPSVKEKRFMLFSDIEEAVLKGEVDAGLIIHENRFTYDKKGLKLIADLGSFWEELTETPLPLGCIIVRKSLGYDHINTLSRIMFRSVDYAMKHPYDAMPFVRANSQEMDEEVMKQHIGLYVNDFTLSRGTRGKVALTYLMELARERGLIP